MDENTLNLAFRETVIVGLAEVKAQNVMILSRLDKINGNVGRLDQKTNALDINLTAHPLTCSMRERIEKLTDSIHTGDYPSSKEVDLEMAALGVKIDNWRNVADERFGKLEQSMTEWTAGSSAEKRTSGKWLGALKPLIYLVVGALVALFLIHASELLR